MKKIDDRENQITNRQLSIVLIQVVVGIGFLSIGRILVKGVGPGAWISLIMGGGIWMGGIFIMSQLAKRFPDQLFFDYVKQILGKPLGTVLSFIYFTYLAFTIGIILNQFLAVLRNFLLPTTPSPVLLLSLLLVVAYMSEKQLKNIGRVYEHLFFVLVPTFLVLVPALFRIDKYNLYFETNIKLWFKGIPTSFFSMAGFESFLFLYPLIKSPKRENSVKAGYLSVSTAVLTYIFIFVISVGYFGQEVIQEIIWPTISLLKAVRIPFFGRVSVFFIVLWINLVFTTVATFYYILYYGLQVELGLKDKRRLHLVLIPLVYLLALLPKNLLKTFEYSSYVGIFSAGFGLVMPLVLWLIAKVRKLGGDAE